MNKTKVIFGSAIVFYFVIALEVLIMISPFAGFFYSVFNPFLLETAKYSSTRWLTAFFLPHMVLPGDGLLKFIRVMGSILLVLGVVIFLVCAFQIYIAKLGRKGAVLSGMYAVIRHPQYLGLGLAGLGLSILWPRFLTVALWLLMALAYYTLAKDEERRMLKSYGESYSLYMKRTGMYLPMPVEKALTPASGFGRITLAIVFAGAVIGGAFLLRAYTVSHLTLWTNEHNIVAVAILPEDGIKMEHRMADVLGLSEVKERLKSDKRYLVYFIPRDYIMQGMIADTGGNWKLYRQHHSLSMITDWIFHPFRHLRAGHHAMHGAMSMQHHAGGNMQGVVRRLIFLSVEDVKGTSPAALFSINAVRVPQFMVDLDVHNMTLLDVKELPHESGWGTVPTPVF
jgi:protein-S-isoprenylcysteine O-methyltransferase Ste14